MSELTKQALKVDNNQSFPNNNAGLITPTALRGFNENMIDSTVNQAVYTADSASFNTRINNITGSATNTGSLLVTASFASQNLTFTKGDGSQFSLFIPDNSGSVLPSGVVSGSSQINYPQISNIPSGIVSGSGQITPLLPSGVVSGSSQVSYTGLSNIPSGIVSGAAQVTPLLPSGVVSGSSQIILQQTTGNLSGSRIDGQVSSALSSSYALTASFALNVPSIPTGSFATTGSNQFNGSQSISGSVRVSGSVTNVDHIDFNTAAPTPSYLNGRVFWDNTDGCLAVYNAEADITLQVGQENWTRVRNNTAVAIANGSPVRLTGAQGDVPTISLAQSVRVSGSANLDNQILGIATHTIEAGTIGYVTTQGLVRGLNTNAFGEGDTLFVSTTAGQLTNTPPTAPFEIIPIGVNVKASPGASGIIYVAVQQPIDFSDLSSVTISGTYGNGDVWLYNSSSLSWNHTSKTLLGLALTGSNNSFSGTQTFNNIVVNGTASIAYIENVTGSAKIIGDAFIILNNDTPTERYAGIIVLDSGSAGVSASFQFDGLTNDWFYEYTGSDPLNFGVAMFGPEYGTKGSPTYLTNNRLPKGDGGHHLNDSNISDDGSNVSINSNTQITGSLLINGNAPLINSNLSSLNTFTESQQSINSNLNAFTSSASGRLNNIELTTASLQSEIDSIQAVTGSYITTSSFNSFSQSVDSRLDNIELTTASLQSEVDNLQSVTGSYATTGSNTFNGNQIINGLTTINVGAAGTESQKDIIVVTGSVIDGKPFTNVVFGLQDYPSFGDNFKDAFVFDYWDSLAYTFGAAYQHNGLRTGTELLASGSGNSFGGAGYGISQLRALGNKSFLNQYASIINIGAYAPSTTDSITIGHSTLPILSLASLRNEISGSTILSGSSGLQITGSVGITGTLTASLQQGYVWVGNANGRTTTVSTGSFGGGGGFPFTGNAVITGSLGVSGSMFGGVIPLSITSNTASVDFSLGNMFTLTLAASATTHIIPTNIRQGQTCNIQITQPTPATGSVAFAPIVLFAGGADYQATATGSAVDMLTLVSFNGTNALGTSIKNFL